MIPLPHRYNVRLEGGPSGYAQLSATGLPALRAAPPAQYDGPGNAWSPEHLLLAAVQTCFLFTFRTIARLARLDFEHLDLVATGIVDRNAGVTRFREIVLRAGLTVAAGTDRQRCFQALTDTETKCLISASLATPIRLEPEVRESDTDQLVGHAPPGRSNIVES